MKYTTEKQTHTQRIILSVLLVTAAVIGVALWRGAQAATSQERLLSALTATAQALSSSEPRESKTTVQITDDSTDVTLSVEGVGTNEDFGGSGSLQLTVFNTPLDVAVEIISVDNKSYMKMNEIASSLERATQGNSALATYTGYAQLVADQLEGEWIEIDALTNSQQCLQAANKLLSKSEAKPFANQLPINESADESGNAVYTLNLSKKQLNTFFAQLNGSAEVAQLSASCRGLVTPLSNDESGRESSDVYTFSFIVSRVSNQIIKVTAEFDNRSISVEHTVKPTEMSLDGIVEPRDAISLKDAQNVLENIIGSPAN